MRGSVEHQLNLEGRRREEIEKAKSPENSVLNKQEGPSWECWPSCGDHRWGTWGEGVWGLEERVAVGSGRVGAGWGGSLGWRQCQCDWVHSEKCPRRPRRWVCFGAPWEFLRDPLGVTDRTGARSRPRTQLSGRRHASRHHIVLAARL